MITQPRSPRFSRVLPGFVLVGLLAACATNPVTGRREFTLMSEAQEIQIGGELDQQVRQQMGIYENDALQAYVEDIGLRLAQASQRPNLPWHFAIVDVAAINAFALPGGYIYLTRGIMPYLDDESELVGVLGHEIGHVTARHAVQQYTRATGATLGLTLGSIFFPGTRPFTGLAETGLGVLFLKYGRDDELQADRLGAEYAAQHGWDPAGVPDMLTTLGRIAEQTDRRGIPNWMSTHPLPEDRVARIQETVTTLQAGDRTLKVDRAGYLDRIDGMVYGDNPEDGILRSGTFLHPDLRFALTFPTGWMVNNGQSEVVAKDPSQEAYLVLQLVDEPRGGTIEEVAVRTMQNAGFRRQEGAPVRVNGLDAYLGSYRGRMQGLGDVLVRAGHYVHGRNVFLVAGVAQNASFAGVEGEFSRALRSFRPLSAEEAANITPNRIAIHQSRIGDTWQSLAQTVGQSNVSPATLAIMNHYPPNEQPQPGSRLKIVVAGQGGEGNDRDDRDEGRPADWRSRPPDREPPG